LRFVFGSGTWRWGLDFFMKTLDKVWDIGEIIANEEAAEENEDDAKSRN